MSKSVLTGQAVRPSLRVDVITERSALEELRPQWLDLLANSPEAIGFSAPGAVLAWYRHVERHSGVYAVTVWRDDELIGLAPFSIARFGPFRLYCSAGAGYGFYGGPLLGPDSQSVAHLLRRHITELVRSGVAAVYLRRMPVEHELLKALTNDPHVTCKAMGSDETNSVVNFAIMPDTEDYFAQVGRKHAVPRRTRRLKEHVSSLDIVLEDPDPNGALDTMRDMILRRFGEDLRMFRGPHNQTLTRDLVHGLIADDHARVSSIVADGRRVAVTFDLHTGTRKFWYAVAYEPEFARFSIGHIELYESLRNAHLSGATQVDLGSSGFDYKRRWANSESRFRTVAVTAPGPRGGMANQLRRASINVHRRLVRARDVGLSII